MTEKEKKVQTRKFRDDLDIGDMTLLDFIDAETHLKELRLIIDKFPVETWMNLPRIWTEIFTYGMDNIKEWQIIIKLQGKEE